MIVTVIESEIHTTSKGEDVIKLIVLDDYETKKYMFIHPHASHVVNLLIKQTKVPIVNKQGRYGLMNLDKLKGKLLSVKEDLIPFRDKIIYSLRLV